MSEKMFPDQNEPDATNPPKEVAGEGPYHLGAWYNAEEGTEEETIEGPGFPKGIDSFELTHEILNIAYAQGLAAKEAEFEKINVRLMKAEAELAKATDRWESLEKKLEIRLSGYLNNEPGLELSSDLRAIKKEMDDLKGGLK